MAKIVGLPKLSPTMEEGTLASWAKKEGERKPVSVVWAKDSRRFAIVRSDQREVGDLWVIHSTGNDRPELETYRYDMPGEENVTQSELWIYDLPGRTATKVTWPDRVQLRQATIVITPTAVEPDSPESYYRVADRLTATPADVSDEVYAAIVKLAGEEGVVELASAIAWENYRARFNRAFEVENEGFCSIEFHGAEPLANGFFAAALERKHA